MVVFGFVLLPRLLYHCPACVQRASPTVSDGPHSLFRILGFAGMSSFFQRIKAGTTVKLWCICTLFRMESYNSATVGCTSGLFLKRVDCAMLYGIHSASCHPYVGLECSSVPLGGVEWENGFVSKYCHVCTHGMHLGTHGVSLKRVVFKCIC